MKWGGVLASIALPALLLATACTVGPDYRRPPVNIPAAYKETMDQGPDWATALPADGVDRGVWWSSYEDPLLDSLVRQVGINNQNVKAYEAAFRRATAVARAARSTLAPQVALSPQVSRARSNDATATSRSIEMAVGWDIDLWGKVRRQVQSDHAAVQASEAELAGVQLSARAELVSDYFQLRYADSLQGLLRSTVEAYQHTLRITQNQYAAGTVARGDVIFAETQLQTTRAQLLAAGISRAQFGHAIALLIGKTPAELTVPVAALSARIPSVPLLMPSRLLERRPDVAQAERIVAQQSALIGVAVAAQFPDVSLSGMLGYAGLASGSLITASNRVWSGAATGNQALFDGGGRSANVAAAQGSYEQSVANYRQVVLTAFEEVESCLSGLRILAEEAEAQRHAVELSRQGVDIALHEYAAGTQSYTTVASAQTLALGNEVTALQVTSERLQQSLALFKALGGGWTASAVDR